MPRLRETPEQEKNRRLQAYIDKNTRLLRYDYKKDVAPRIGLKPTTYREKYNNPSRFKRNELMRLFAVLKFTPEEIADIW